MNVLVCVDHSPESVNAAESAARSGLLDRRSVFLLHVCSGAEVTGEDRALVSQVERICKLFASPAELTRVFAFGKPSDVILQNAAMFKADLLVVGAHERSGLERLVLGSVSQSVIARSEVPVLLARQSDFTGSGKILVALDDSNAAASSLEWIAKEAWTINKEIVLLSIVERLGSSFFTESSVAKAAEQLAQHDWKESQRVTLLEHWGELLSCKLGSERVPSAVADGLPQEQILKAAVHWGAEIVVLSANSKLRSDRLLLGSVSQALATKLPNAVLIVPESGAGDFERLRQTLHSCDELGLVLSEKPHPAKTYTSITGTDINGFMPYS